MNNLVFKIIKTKDMVDYKNLNEFLNSKSKGSHLTKAIKQEVDQHITSLNLDAKNLQLGAKLYLLRNNLSSIPRCAKCDKELVYHAPSCSYRTFCSNKCSLNSTETINKRRQTNVQKYGVVNVLNKDRAKRNKEFISTMYDELSRFKDFVVPNFTKKEFKAATAKNAYSWQCVRCNNAFKRVFIPSLHKWPKCPQCDSTYTDIETFVSEFFKEYNIHYRPHYRKVIKNRELDFFLPEHKIAIETHGLFYHTECFFPDSR